MGPTKGALAPDIMGHRFSPELPSSELLLEKEISCYVAYPCYFFILLFVVAPKPN